MNLSGLSPGKFAMSELVGTRVIVKALVFGVAFTAAVEELRGSDILKLITSEADTLIWLFMKWIP
jgi:UDP-N-acetyl-D-mannosaminuronate dehydrogenase